MEESIKPNFGEFIRLNAIQIVLYIAKAILIYQFGFKENSWATKILTSRLYIVRLEELRNWMSKKDRKKAGEPPRASALVLGHHVQGTAQPVLSSSLEEQQSKLRKLPTLGSPWSCSCWVEPGS